MSTRWRCSPRSGPVRAARRAGRRAPGGARGPRRARERVPRWAVCARARGVWGRHRKPDTLARAPARACAGVARRRCFSSGFRPWPDSGPHFQASTRRPRCPGSRDDDSPAPLPPRPSGVPGDLVPRRPLWSGRQCLGSRAAPQGGHLRLPSWEGPWASRALRLCGGEPCDPSLPGWPRGAPAGTLTARPVYPDGSWGWGVEPRLLLGASLLVTRTPLPGAHRRPGPVLQ